MHNKLAAYGVSKFLKTFNATEPDYVVAQSAWTLASRTTVFHLAISRVINLA